MEITIFVSSDRLYYLTTSNTLYNGPGGVRSINTDNFAKRLFELRCKLILSHQCDIVVSNYYEATPYEQNMMLKMEVQHIKAGWNPEI